MIKVYGRVELNCNFAITLDMTEEEFDGLDDFEREKLIEGSIDWQEVVDLSDVDDIDIWNITGLEEQA